MLYILWLSVCRTRKRELMEKNCGPAATAGPRTRGRGCSVATTQQGADTTVAEGAGEQEVCSGEQGAGLDVSTPCCSQDLVYRSTPTPGVQPSLQTRTKRADRGNQSKEPSCTENTIRQSKVVLSTGTEGPSTRTRRKPDTLLEQNNGGAKGTERGTARSTRLRKEPEKHKSDSRGNENGTVCSEGKAASHSEVRSRGKESAPCGGYQTSTRKRFVLRCRKEK